MNTRISNIDAKLCEEIFIQYACQTYHPEIAIVCVVLCA